MRIHMFFTALVSSVTAFASSDSLDVKTGLWEMADANQAHGILQPRLTCITALALKKGAFRSETDDRTCRYTSLTHTSTVQEESVQCANADGRRGTFKVEAQDRDHIIATFVQDTGVAVHVAGKWVAASCSAGDENTAGMPAIGVDRESGEYNAHDNCVIKAPNGFCIEEEQ